AEVVARLALVLELALDHDLCRDAGVVGAHYPVGVEAAHAVVAHERVHQGLLEGVAHVQRAGYVGRRQLDAVRGRGAWKIRVSVAEITGRLPALVPALLYRLGLEAFFQG